MTSVVPGRLLRPRQLVAIGAAMLVLAALVVVHLGGRAEADARARCARHAADAARRADQVTGSGTGVLVIGDSWSVGLGLRDLGTSWPSQLPGRVQVAGFSGSGFSRAASPCGNQSFAARAARSETDSAGLVLVEGGLNDVNQSDEAISLGFARLMHELDDRPVVVVGPAPAPSRAASVPRVDRRLAELCAAYEVPYLSAADWRLPYGRDRLHLTPAGHELFGTRVADELADRGLLG